MTSTEYLLPQLPFGGSEITIVRWLKRAGDSVSAGEPLLVVVNDRVEAALPAICAGILDRLWSAEGAAVAAGARVATIVANSAATVSNVLDAAQSTVIEIEQAADAVPSNQQISKSTVRISPVARRIANSMDIDITELQGTGVSGRIMKADILAALAEQAPKPEALPFVLPLVPHLPSVTPPALRLSPISHPPTPTCSRRSK